MAEARAESSKALAKAIGAADFSDRAALIVGCGVMGKHYFRALEALNVGRVGVCSRSAASLEELAERAGVTCTSGGYQNLEGPTLPDQLVIVATPIADLVPAALHLADLGYRRILIEKPVSLHSKAIASLADSLERQGVEAVCAYNRLAYPSLIEVRHRCFQDGGITSVSYDFTEWAQPGVQERHPAKVLERWGLANSLHVIGMAHRLIGMPTDWSGHRSGILPWHTSGSAFVGAGISECQVPFSYTADWNSKGRWSVDINTRRAAYRLCPLEDLYVKSEALGGWEKLPIESFAPGVKAGVAEQLAAMLNREVNQMVPLISLREAARLAEFGEEIFGYGAP